MSLQYLAQVASHQSLATATTPVSELINDYYSNNINSQLNNQRKVRKYDGVGSPMETFHRVFGHGHETKARDELLKAIESYHTNFEQKNRRQPENQAIKRECEFELPFSITKRTDNYSMIQNSSCARTMKRTNDLSSCLQEEPIDLSVRKKPHDIVDVMSLSSSAEEREPSPVCPVSAYALPRECHSAPTLKTDYLVAECRETSIIDASSEPERPEEATRGETVDSDFNHNTICKSAVKLSNSSNEVHPGHSVPNSIEKEAYHRTESSVENVRKSQEAIQKKIAPNDAVPTVIQNVPYMMPDMSHLPLYLQFQTSAFSSLFNQYEKVYGLAVNKEATITGQQGSNPLPYLQTINSVKEIKGDGLHNDLQESNEQPKIEISENTHNKISRPQLFNDTNSNSEAEPMVECSVTVAEVEAPPTDVENKQTSFYNNNNTVENYNLVENSS